MQSPNKLLFWDALRIKLSKWVEKMLSAPPSQPAEESRHPRRCKKYQKMKIFPLLVQLSAPHHPTPVPQPARRPRNQPAELKSQYGKINAGLWAGLMCTLEYDGTVNLNPGKFYLILSRSLFHQDFQRKRKLWWKEKQRGQTNGKARIWISIWRVVG